MKIKNLLAALTAACLFATSFSAVASDETFKETIEATKSENGTSLQEHPKVKPDGNNYYFDVVELRKVLSENQQGVTVLTVGREGPMVVFFLHPTLMALSYKELAPYYQALYDYFLDNAALGQRFKLVGKYSKNEEFTDATVPFIGAYWVEFKGKPFNLVYDVNKIIAEQKQANATPKENETQKAEVDSGDDYCKNAYATGNMPGMIECEGDALKVEDKRLNQEYKTVMSKLDKDQKKALRTKQRAWIKDRDKACKAEEDGGQAAELDHVSCLKEWTKKRADELAAMR